MSVCCDTERYGTRTIWNTDDMEHRLGSQKSNRVRSEKEQPNSKDDKNPGSDVCDDESPSPVICRSSRLLCIFVKLPANVRRYFVLDIGHARSSGTAGSLLSPARPFDVHVVTSTIQPHAVPDGQVPHHSPAEPLTIMAHRKSRARGVPSRMLVSPPRVGASGAVYGCIERHGEAMIFEQSATLCRCNKSH
jgi:hypothetical protein